MDSDLDPTYSTRTGLADMPDTDAPETNEEIERARADIEATRTDMAETLEAIKDKLNPADLMDQAKEKVAEVAGDLTDKAKDAVHTMIEDATTHAKDAVTGAVTGTVDTAKEMVSGVVDTAKHAGTSVIDTIKRNPIPSALAVFGAAWLYLKNRDGGSRVSASYPASPSSGNGRSMIDQARENSNAIPSASWSGTGSTNEGAAMGIVDTIKSNPVPAAVAVGAAAWLYLKNKDENKAYRSDNMAPYPSGSYGTTESSDTAHGMMDTAREKAGQVMDAAGNWVDTAKDTASHLTDAAKDKASQLTGAAKDKASQLTSAAKEHVGAMGTHVSEMGSSVADSFQSSPLPIGMVALGVGMAVGLLVPETERENQWMGATRDRLVERAQDTAQDIAGKVQTVAQETFDAAKTTVQEQAKAQGLMGGGQTDSEQSSGQSNSSDTSAFNSSLSDTTAQTQSAPMDQMQDAFDIPMQPDSDEQTQTQNRSDEVEI